MTRVQIVIFFGSSIALRVTRTEGAPDVVVWYIDEDADLLTAVLSPEWLATPDTLLPEGYELGLRSERY